jgi:hypothetical protein
MLELAGSIALMVVVVGGAITWSLKNGLRERFSKGGRHGHRA